MNRIATLADKKKEAFKIKSPPDAADFILKHHPDLTKFNPEAKEHIREDLEVIFKALAELTDNEPIKYDVVVNGRRTRSYSKKEFLKKIDTLEKFKRKINLWRETPIEEEAKNLIASIESLIKAYRESIPPPKQGGKEDMRNIFFRDIVVNFWFDVLGHKKFFYDDLNDHPDLANRFVDDFVLAHYRGKEIKEIHGLQASFIELSDRRK